MIYCLPECKGLFRLLKTYLVAAGGEVEFLERGLVTVGHVMTATEEHQCTGIIRQGAPVHVNAALLLAERNDQDNVNNDTKNDKHA